MANESILENNVCVNKSNTTYVFLLINRKILKKEISIKALMFVSPA